MTHEERQREIMEIKKLLSELETAAQIQMVATQRLKQQLVKLEEPSGLAGDGEDRGRDAAGGIELAGEGA